MRDEIRNHGGTGAALGKRRAITSDLSKNGRNIPIQEEVFVFDEKTPNAPKVDGREKVL
jgi:helix-turn-helix protein